MAANTSMIFSKNPHVGTVTIPQTNAVARSSGTSSGTGAEIMYCVFNAGAAGSFVKKLRFVITSDSASTLSTATVLRIFTTSVSQTEGAASGATTNSNTHLWGEVNVPAITADAPTTATNSYDVVFNDAIQIGMAILVCQHVAQSGAVNWEATCFGGDY